MIRRLLAPVEILRPHNMLAAAFSVAAGYYIAGGRDLETIGLTLLLTALVTGAGNVINDYHDVDIDRVNKPARVLPSGRMTPRAALAWYFVLTLPVTAVAFVALPLSPALVIVAWQAALFVYARWAKRILFANNLLVATVTSSAFVLGAMLNGAINAAVIPTLIAFVFVLSREIVKGAEDVSGDQSAGVRTVALRFGAPVAAAVAFVMMLTVIAAIPIPTLLGTYSRYYFWLMEATVVPGLLYSMYLVARRGDRRAFNRASWVLKGTMFFGILAIALGR